MSDRHDEPDSYPWRAAPAHLKTRRQLRAAGLRPNGQEPVAQIEGRRYGRRIWAALFDIERAAPKRSATPAQMKAVRKAVVERQARAAERRGISRAELHIHGDPGPGWATDQKEINMTDTDLNNLHDQMVDRFGTAQDPEDGTPVPDTTQRGTLHEATGRGQRVAAVLSLAAVNLSRRERELQALEADAVARSGSEERETAYALALEERMREGDRVLAEPVRWEHPVLVAEQLREAVVWRDTSSVAAAQLAEITAGLADRWGVLVDPDRETADTVGIDRSFDALAAQTRAEAAAMRAREDAIVETLLAAPLASTVRAALTDVLGVWRATAPETDPADYITSAARRDAALWSALDEMKEVPAQDRALLEFTVGYLRGDTSEVDLLTVPTMVDPGVEARGRISALLDRYADAGGRSGTHEIRTEMAVLSAQDQQAVSAAGRAARDGDRRQLWPDHADRDAIYEQLLLHAGDVEELVADADAYVEDTGYDPRIVGAEDDLGVRIERMVTAQGRIEAMASSEGLAAVERAEIAGVLRDLGTHTAGDTALPELMWADDRSMRHVDYNRTSHQPWQHARQLHDAIAAKIQASAGIDITSTDARHGFGTARNLATAAGGVRDAIYRVGTGVRGGEVPAEQETSAQRADFLARRDELGRALAAASIDQDVKLSIRDDVTAAARDAITLGRAVDARRDQWSARTAAVIAARDDAAAQRSAANAGRPAVRARAHTARSTTTAAAADAGPSRPAPHHHAARRTGQELGR